jgi:hypothetical protein
MEKQRRLITWTTGLRSRTRPSKFVLPQPTVLRSNPVFSPSCDHQVQVDHRYLMKHGLRHLLITDQFDNTYSSS